MARSRRTGNTASIIETEKRWRNVCDNCKSPLLISGTKAAIAPKIYTVPRLIFLPESRIPLIIPTLSLHLLICDACLTHRGEPVAVEDYGFFREQKILWDKPEETRGKNEVTKFCGLCAATIKYKRDAELKEKAGGIYALPRLMLDGGELRQIETRSAEIRLVICKDCVSAHYRPLGVEQTWRFEGDILRPELVTIKRGN